MDYSENMFLFTYNYRWSCNDGCRFQFAKQANKKLKVQFEFSTSLVRIARTLMFRQRWSCSRVLRSDVIIGSRFSLQWHDSTCPEKFSVVTQIEHFSLNVSELSHFSMTSTNTCLTTVICLIPSCILHIMKTTLRNPWNALFFFSAYFTT